MFWLSPESDSASSIDMLSGSGSAVDCVGVSATRAAARAGIACGAGAKWSASSGS
jgi:hypothetical protein